MMFMIGPRGIVLKLNSFGFHSLEPCELICKHVPSGDVTGVCESACN